MAIHAVCEFCGHKMSVPDRLKGKKMSCPGCGKKTHVLTALELDVMKAKKETHANSRPEKQREETKKEPAPKPPQQTVTEEKKPAPETVTTRYPALRTFRSVFTFFAYLIGILGVAVGVIIFLSTKSPQHGLLLLLGFFVGGAVAFCILKLMAETARLGADLGDMESRMLELLFDMRDRFDRLKK